MIILLLSLIFLAQPAAAQRGDHNLYAEGGIRRPIHGPRDKTTRIISMQLYCDKDAEGYVYSKLGIFDVTDPHDSYGRYFNLDDFSYRNGKTFELDDRTPGHRSYTLTISPAAGGSIKFGRPGNENQITTSQGKLLNIRARHAIDKGLRVTIGSKQFLVTSQQGTLPGFAFFKGDLAARLANGDSDAAYEQFCVKTMSKASGGKWTRERGPLPIGKVDGLMYELAWNPQIDQWVIQQR